jgi:hypothetical protein
MMGDAWRDGRAGHLARAKDAETMIMGKLIIEGWSKPGAEIPQSTSIVTGANLRRRPAPPSPDRPFGIDLEELGRWDRPHLAIE